MEESKLRRETKAWWVGSIINWRSSRRDLCEVMNAARRRWQSRFMAQFVKETTWETSKQEAQKRVRSLQRLPLFADRPPVPSLFRVRSAGCFPQTYVGRCSFPSGRRPLSHRRPAVADIPCCIANLPFPRSQKNLCEISQVHDKPLFFPFLFFSFFFLFFFFFFLAILRSLSVRHILKSKTWESPYLNTGFLEIAKT